MARSLLMPRHVFPQYASTTDHNQPSKNKSIMIETYHREHSLLRFSIGARCSWRSISELYALVLGTQEYEPKDTAKVTLLTSMTFDTCCHKRRASNRGLCSRSHARAESDQKDENRMCNYTFSDYLYRIQRAKVSRLL